MTHCHVSILFSILALGCSSGAPVSSPQPEELAAGPALASAQAPATELRGAWVTRWSYREAADVELAMEQLAEAGFNAVFFQIRGTFDAFWRSDIEPWSALLTGTLGRDPGWDPLAVAVEQGHAHGLQVHAYMNVFPFWRGKASPGASEPAHAMRGHPDWRVTDADGQPMALNDSYVFASPGKAQVRARVAAVAAEIAQRYAVDGIHLDYIRYPASDCEGDAASVAARRAASLSCQAWQRLQVIETVRAVRQAVDLPLSAAVWGVYQNSWGWESVSQGLDDYHQDSRAFLSQGLLDANIPMIYWRLSEPPGQRLDFATLTADHLAHASGRHVYPGIQAELGHEAVADCIAAAPAAGAPGVVLFDYRTAQQAGWLSELARGPFAEPAVPPAMPWRE